MHATLSISQYRLPLVRPYALSFGTLTHFDTFYVYLRANDRVGLGEITPLPGYGFETVAGVSESISNFKLLLDKGLPYIEAARTIHAQAPMTGSGLACALETWKEGPEHSLLTPLKQKLPLAAFCPGDTPEEASIMAQKLAKQGFTSLKLKVGRMEATKEIALIQAVCQVLPPGSDVRLDANQRSSTTHAAALCAALEGLPVAHFEQPFAQNDWAGHEQLAKDSLVPILLDESIENLPDIQRASNCGVRAIKLKLCKHLGLTETQEMVIEAQRLGMGIVFGNGVQSALGNHLEARIASKTGIDSALELNGFTKIAQSPFQHELCVQNGMLIDRGLGASILNVGPTRDPAPLTFQLRQLENN